MFVRSVNLLWGQRNHSLIILRRSVRLSVHACRLEVLSGKRHRPNRFLGSSRLRWPLSCDPDYLRTHQWLLVMTREYKISHPVLFLQQQFREWPIVSETWLFFLSNNFFSQCPPLLTQYFQIVISTYVGPNGIWLRFFSVESLDTTTASVTLLMVLF